MAAPPSGSEEWEQQHAARRVPTGNFEEIDKKLGGQFGRGNLDLNGRQVHFYDNGKDYSSLESITIEHDGQHVLIPKVNEKGDLLSNEKAIEMYKKTGKYLGKFGSDNEATDYAIGLERRQQAYYENGPGRSILEGAKKRGRLPQ